MTNPINDLYGDQVDGFEPTELETAQAQSILNLQQELADLKGQAQNPAAGAVEQPAEPAPQPDVPQLDLSGATNLDAAVRLVQAYDPRIAAVTVTPDPTITREEVIAQADAAQAEATSMDDLIGRLRGIR